MINNVSLAADAIWILQSGNLSSHCGSQFVMDCSDPRICTSVIDPSVFIAMGLDSIYQGVTRSLMEAWVTKDQALQTNSFLPVQSNGATYCHVQELYLTNPYVTEYYLLSATSDATSLCQNGLKCVNKSVQIFGTLDCSDEFSTILPLNYTVQTWNNAYNFSLWKTNAGTTQVAWTTFSPSFLVFAKLSNAAGVCQFLFYLAGGMLATYIFQLYIRKALEKKKILFKHVFFIISSFLWMAYIVAETMLLMYQTTDQKTTAALVEISKLFMVLGSGASTATNAYNMQRVVLHENTPLNQILTGALWFVLLVLYTALAGPYFFVYIFYTYQNLTVTQLNLYNKWLLPVSGSWMIFCLAFDPFSCLAILTFIIHSMRSSMRDEPVSRAIYFLFGDSKLLYLVNASIFNLVLDVILVQIKNHTLLLQNDYNNLFLDGIQSFIYVLNAWISIMLIEHIPETMKRASIFTNPATKSITDSEFKSEMGNKAQFPSSSAQQGTGYAANSKAMGASSAADSKMSSKYSDQ